MSDFEKYNLSLDDERKDFVDSKIIDFISGPGKKFKNRTSRVKKMVSEVVAGTTLKTDDLIRNIQMRGPSPARTVVASKIMRLIILGGGKVTGGNTVLPRNEKRREFVDERFFPEDSTFLNDPFLAQHEAGNMPPGQGGNGRRDYRSRKYGRTDDRAKRQAKFR